ncbi:hypothetical protein B0H14DRAFT_3466546 [Mycena olivaceomarginata]|nr:hypothetical protein B0H14DRAFT_3466546 [Mycena olivaceomarginata]
MSVHRRCPPASPVSSLTRATNELLELTQQMTPSKPPDVLRRLRRDLQSHANNIRDDITTLKRQLTNIELQSAAAQHLRKTRRRGRRADFADNSIENPQTIEQRTSEKGRHFVVQEALFLLDDVFSVDEDEDFDPKDEFASDKNKVQGQLHRILEFLPADVKHLRTTELISGTFVDSMSGQCSSTSHRLHGPGLTHIVDDVKPFATSPGRHIAFRTLIGWQPGTKTHEPYYSKLDVPILYDGWQGEDLTHLFRGPCLLKIHATIIRGPKGAVDLFDGIPKRPAAKTIEKMYKIKFSTLGAIVNTSILAIWLHSADTQLTEIGDETGINYRERHSYYMQRIIEALASKKAWALDLVAYWDRILFPDADAPQSTSAGDQRLEDAEDDNDFFDSAPAVESPMQPVRPTNPASRWIPSRQSPSTMQRIRWPPYAQDVLSPLLLLPALQALQYNLFLHILNDPHFVDPLLLALTPAVIPHLTQITLALPHNHPAMRDFPPCIHDNAMGALDAALMAHPSPSFEARLARQGMVEQAIPDARAREQLIFARGA